MKLSSSILRLAALPMLAAAFSTPAHAGYGMQAHGQLLDLGVYDRDSQQRLPVYWHNGRYYVAGVPGHRYQLTLRNRDGEDLLVVPSVDGVNAYTGETADWSQGGYVLDGYTSYDIKGWRKSLTQVAGFVFADASRSYAARTGRPDNVGVIGMAIFRRQAAIVDAEPAPRERYADDFANNRQAPTELARSAQAPAPAPMSVPAAPPAPIAEASVDAAAPRRAEGGFAVAKTSGPLGTGFGRRERDDIHLVDFERASSQPEEVVTIYYDTYANLVARGVLPSGGVRPYAPEAFPGRFVPDPPGG